MLKANEKYSGMSGRNYLMSMPSEQLALLEMPKLETMGTRIRRLREARNLTQDQLAKRCGVARSAVHQWETGESENIKLQPWLRLLRTLDVSAHYLVFGRETPPAGFWLDDEVAEYEAKRRGNGGQ
jgi:DNA-binding transcriptional regulator YiaG